jgi:hypothetical protein
MVYQWVVTQSLHVVATIVDVDIVGILRIHYATRFYKWMEEPLVPGLDPRLA